MDAGSNNAKIHAMLVELAESEKARGDVMKANAYTKAAISVKAHSKLIMTGKQAEKDLAGVGKKIAKKIDELLSTGSLDRLERDRADADLTVLKDLQRVSGIGIKFAQDLRTTHGIRDVAMLRRRTDLLTHEQQIGLRHLDDFEARIPRAEMVELEKAVRSATEGHNPPLQMTVCGSYRRGRPSSGDIDCLLCHPSYQTRDAAAVPDWLSSVVDALKASGFLTDVISLGKKKCHAVCRLLPPTPTTTDGNTSAETSSAQPPVNAAAAVLPKAFKLPSAKDVQMRRARLLQSKLPATDLFSSWKAGKGASSEPSSGGSGGSNTHLGSALTPPTTASSSADASTAGAAGDDGGFGGFGGFDVGDERRYRRLDLRLVPYECYHASTLYFTGSDEHNKKMRNAAIAKGLKLSEYGLFQNANGEAEAADATPLAVQSEQDIFKLLGMPYAAPEERDI